MSTNSNALGFDAKISITRSTLLFFSLWICIKAKPLSRGCPIDDLKYVFSRQSTLPDLSHSHDVTGMVAVNCNSTNKFGYILSSHFFKAEATVCGLSLSGVTAHLRFHRKNSSSAESALGRSSEYNWIASLMGIYFRVAITDGTRPIIIRTVFPYLSNRVSIPFIKWSRKGIHRLRR